MLRLCLMTIAWLSLSSCRQDILPEQETYNNTSAFLLTSKRISLGESKHKAKLITELKKAEVEIETYAKNNAHAKTMSFGNGISVDTESVVYIENGPNYHTYTFNVIRDNALANDPLENLVLSPLTDGTYRELLISYNLTPQEKLALQNGENIDTEGKTTITDLGTGISSQLLGKSQNCGWTTATAYTPCSEGMHFNGEGAKICKAPVKSQKITVSLYVCGEDGSGGNSPGAPTGPGVGTIPGGEGGGDPGEGVPGGSPENNDCDGTGILTAPQTPTLGISDDGCGNGVPTQPNTGTSTPCTKIKAQRSDTEFDDKITDLEGKIGLTKETGYIQKWGGSYEYKDNAGATSDANTLHLPEVATNDYLKAFMHTHINDVPNSEKKGVKMFSPADVVYFMDLVQNAQTKGQSLSDPYAVMVTSIGNYQIRFTGNKFQIKTFSDEQAKSHRDPFIEAMKNYIDKPKQLELRFLKYIQEKMLLYGITLYRMNSDGTTTEIKLNADKSDTVENQCPN